MALFYHSGIFLSIASDDFIVCMFVYLFGSGASVAALSSARVRRCGSVAAVSPARGWPCGSVTAICSRRAVGIAALSRQFAIGARPVMWFWRGSFLGTRLALRFWRGAFLGVRPAMRFCRGGFLGARPAMRFYCGFLSQFTPVFFPLSGKKRRLAVSCVPISPGRDRHSCVLAVSVRLSAFVGLLWVWLFICGDLDGVPECGERGYGVGGAALVRLCAAALVLLCFPRGVRWGSAPQTCAKESSTLWTLFTLRRGCAGAYTRLRHS